MKQVDCSGEGMKKKKEQNEEETRSFFGNGKWQDTEAAGVLKWINDRRLFTNKTDESF